MLLLAFALVFLLYAWLGLPYTIIGAMAPFPMTIALCIFAAVNLAYAGNAKPLVSGGFSTRGLGCGRCTFD